ncbi:MAG: hypothetical protein R3346_03695 [Candidatus Spechtbacterales bacterium]|nr:hypothetical protein [Candidatus Spechtbacterales bacterium]
MTTDESEIPKLNSRNHRVSIIFSILLAASMAGWMIVSASLGATPLFWLFIVSYVFFLFAWAVALNRELIKSY